MIYDEAFFIKKFEPISEEMWVVNAFARRRHKDGTQRCCALGHCGVRSRYKITEEGKELNSLAFARQKKLGLTCYGIGAVNDGFSVYRRLGEGPKERVMKFLQLPLEELQKILGD